VVLPHKFFFGFSTRPPIALLLHGTFLVEWGQWWRFGEPSGIASTGFFHPLPYVMQITISTRHGDVSDATKEKIAQKIEKFQRFFDRLVSVDVTVDLDKADEPNIEVAVRSEKRQDFVASYRSNDLFGAVDQVIGKLEQQIKKHKEKLKERGKNVPLEDE